MPIRRSSEPGNYACRLWLLGSSVATGCASNGVRHCAVRRIRSRRQRPTLLAQLSSGQVQRQLGLFLRGGHRRVASRQMDVAEAGGRGHHIDIRKEARHPGEDEVVQEKRVGLVCHEPSHERLSHESIVPAAANQSGLTSGHHDHVEGIHAP